MKRRGHSCEPKTFKNPARIALLASSSFSSLLTWIGSAASKIGAHRRGDRYSSALYCYFDCYLAESELHLHM